MSETLTPEQQAATDHVRAVHAAIEERDLAAKAELDERAAELVDGYVKAREDAAKAEAKAAAKAAKDE